MKGSEAGSKIKQLESDITFHIGKQEAELTLRVNCAAFYDDLYQLKSLIRAGADPKKTDYDGRSPLVRLLFSYKRFFVFVSSPLETKEGKIYPISANSRFISLCKLTFSEI